MGLFEKPAHPTPNAMSTTTASSQTLPHPMRVVVQVAALALALAAPARAEDVPAGWDPRPGPASPTGPPADTTAPPSPLASPDANITVVPRTPGEAAGDQDRAAGQVRLVALLTADGQRIDQGLVWRVFQGNVEADGKSKLVSTSREASPTLKLQPGDYVINAAFGRAHLTRRVSIKPGGGEPAVEQFVLNAGGLRVKALLGSAEAPANSISYNIYSDRDQSDNRKLIMAAAKPGLVIRLNAGIYYIVSTYGDANAIVRSDVTVEAGKLTEAAVVHTAARATFKLVARAGGEALPDTQWTIQTEQGEIVKESAGALPAHILAPGTYKVVAKSRGKAFQRAFTLTDGEITQVEVIKE